MQAMRPPPETKIPLETPQLGYDLPTPETWRQRFRGFCYMETMGPQEVCSRLWEFALRWLEPQRRSKEQMLELVVLEQFLAILPREMQSWQWGHGVETCAEAVTLAEGFKLGQEEEEKLQVIVSVKAEEVSSDNMHPAAASQEPGDSWPVQPKAECVDRPLEDSGERETPGPLDKPLQVSKEDPQSHQDSGGAWLLSRGEEKPPVEEPADLEPAQTSPGSLGEMDSLRPEKEPRHKSQGKPRKQKENVVVNKQRRIHPGRKTHRCKKCRKNFSCMQDLSQHQCVQSGEQPYLCTRCGKSFKQPSMLARHLFMHTREKPHQCSECGKRFNLSSILAKHQLIHKREKPHRCSECGDTFTHPSSLTQHKRIHTGEKPHRCLECGKSFARSSSLARHGLTHTGEKPHQCLECGKSFTLSFSLTTHQLIHTGEKPHQCSECGKRFTQFFSLARHQFIHARKEPHQ
ncbi:zinc finger protein 391-like [Alligator mississippiensis]|uniref:zinc finger protein 391-like n=1 Tax=Alligator mississippiensis TaxID=8496 RepID=UPI002877932E|nr:zinc finger protein 391-like [Alligator mississippiensis]XP_059574933.1 zinc finger protein 391-like [Alligator mississippiensis]XP_059574934.1 zinc finger protein 391-like [Alligator mississippiensis]